MKNMKRILIITLFALPCLIGFVYLFNMNSQNDQGDIRKSYYENGKLKEERPYIEDKKHGVAKEYDNGELWVERPRVNGHIGQWSKW